MIKDSDLDPLKGFDFYEFHWEHFQITAHKLSTGWYASMLSATQDVDFRLAIAVTSKHNCVVQCTMIQNAMNYFRGHKLIH